MNNYVKVYLILLAVFFFIIIPIGDGGMSIILFFIICGILIVTMIISAFQRDYHWLANTCIVLLAVFVLIVVPIMEAFNLLLFNF